MRSSSAVVLRAIAFGAATLAWTSVATADDRALYYGGRVISNVEVVVVYWTSAVDPMIESGIGPFLSAITASPYIDWLEEYDTIALNGQDGKPGSNQHIGRGTFGGARTISPKNTSMTLLDSDVQTELIGQINAGSLPMPTTDGSGNVNTLYMIEFPAGYTIEVEGKYNCSSYCGYHFTLSYEGPSGLDPAISVPYAVMPDITACGGSCGSGFDEVTSIHSHELVESITDTEIGLLTGPTLTRPAAWYDETDNMELADICDPFDPAPGITGGTAVVAGYTVQLIWSDFASACVATIPVCDGTTTQPSCRPCTAYDDGVDCTGSTPVCQTEFAAPNAGQCVGCASDANCAVPTPICDKTTSTCRACMKSDCTGVTNICGTNGACVQCEDSDYSACTGATPTCDVTTGRCVGCQSNIDCPAKTPVCNRATNRCQACGASIDCPSGLVCDTGKDALEGECVDCNTTSDCTFGTCEPATHTCFTPSVDAGAPPKEAGAVNEASPTASGSGCSCRAAPSRGLSSFGVFGMAVATLLARRRRRVRPESRASSDGTPT
jgi:MYXO-CTERM domain-containing protein